MAVLWVTCNLPLGPLLAGGATGPGTAVVVGISDFEDSKISNLRFADRDALAFSAFLEEALPQERIRTLTNDAATLAAIQSALSWQLASSSPGSTAYLYLATHGDIEATNLDAPGYLLAFDTPYNNYNLLALGLDYLNAHLLALAEKEVQAILITDACHAGSLSGNSVAGRELTAVRLKDPQATEIRLLSCQPYELSYESERWGEGRGVFSYHLVRALQGAADVDRNQRIDLFELEQYVKNHVSQETERKQHPEFTGGRKDESPFGVGAQEQREFLEERSASVESTFEEAQLALVPERTQLDYVRFHRALLSKRLLGSAEGSALDYYRHLRAEPSLLPLRGLLDERITIALLDSVQQAIQDYLEADQNELMEREQLDEKYLNFPAFLAESVGILGTHDPRYSGIEAKRLYFEGLVLRLRTNFTNRSDSLLSTAEEYLTEAVALAPEAAYMHNELGIVQDKLGRDSLAQLAFERAQALAPTWALPYNNLSNLLQNTAPDSNFNRILEGYEKAIALRPDLGVAYMNYGNLCRAFEMRDSAIFLLRKASLTTPSLVEAKYNLANVLIADSAGLQEAINLYRTVIDDRPQMVSAYYGIGYAFEISDRPDSAENYYLRALEIPNGKMETYLYPALARIYTYHKKEFGRLYFGELMRNAPLDPYGYTFTAVLDTSDRQWMKTLSRLTLPEKEHFDLVTSVAVELFQYDAFKLAVEAALLAADKHSKITEAHRNLTDILLLSERIQEAESAARRTLFVAQKNHELEELCQYVQEVDLYKPLLEENSLLSLYQKRCRDWQPIADAE